MKSKVYFIPLKDGATPSEQAEGIKKIYDFSGAGDIVSKNDFVALKVHLGEKGNETYLKPDLIKVLVDKIKERQGLPFLTETSTLYKGERHNAVQHILHAQARGFGIENIGAPFIMSDGLLGNTEQEVPINGDLYKSVNVANEILSCDVLFVITHVTGHIGAGMGASIKNLGMGLASRKGKLKQHSAMKPSINKECTFCKKCMDWCPEDAIIEKDKKAWIIPEKCVGCGECLSVCRFNAVNFDWGAESGFTQKSMAEHSLGVVKNKKCFYFNVMVDMTKNCDCWSSPEIKLIPDIGILGSFDPVAIDKASLDLTGKISGKTIAHLAYSNQNPLIQIEHAVKIGLGYSEYDLIEVK